MHYYAPQAHSDSDLNISLNLKEDSSAMHQIRMLLLEDFVTATGSADIVI